MRRRDSITDVGRSAVMMHRLSGLHIERRYAPDEQRCVRALEYLLSSTEDKQQNETSPDCLAAEGLVPVTMEASEEHDSNS